MAENHQLMATICVGYKTYVMPVDDAVAVAKALATAQLYDTKYRNEADGGTTHHIFDQDLRNLPSVQLMSYEAYRLAKLAGPPV